MKKFVELDWILENSNKMSLEELLQKAPAITLDEESLKQKSHWLRDKYDPEGAYIYICNNCWGGRHKCDERGYEHWNYCPNCGCFNGNEREDN